MCDYFALSDALPNAVKGFHSPKLIPSPVVG
jgi:hypothetical protein